MTRPSVAPCCRANCFAALRRSSSSSKVVRIQSQCTITHHLN
jgi:hypothetical protein